MFNQLLWFFPLSLCFGFIGFAEFITQHEFGIPLLSLPETSHLRQTSPCADTHPEQEGLGLPTSSASVGGMTMSLTLALLKTKDQFGWSHNGVVSEG